MIGSAIITIVPNWQRSEGTDRTSDTGMQSNGFVKTLGHNLGNLHDLQKEDEASEQDSDPRTDETGRFLAVEHPSEPHPGTAAPPVWIMPYQFLTGQTPASLDHGWAGDKDILPQPTAHIRANGLLNHSSNPQQLWALPSATSPVESIVQDGLVHAIGSPNQGDAAIVSHAFNPMDAAAAGHSKNPGERSAGEWQSLAERHEVLIGDSLPEDTSENPSNISYGAGPPLDGSVEPASPSSSCLAVCPQPTSPPALSPAQQIGLRMQEAFLNADTRPNSPVTSNVVRSLRIVLKPEALGHVDVKMTVRGDRLLIRLTALRGETAVLLQRDSRHLELLVEQVTGPGLTAVVSLGHDTQLSTFWMDGDNVLSGPPGERNSGSHNSPSRSDPTMPDKESNANRNSGGNVQHETGGTMDSIDTGVILV